jgi:glycine/D-amino acid oxidase-like deaminating enzyme
VIDESRYRARSLWLDGLAGSLAPRPALPGDRSCDVVVVGAGFGGLWTAYALATTAPHLDVVLIEAEIAGYGPAGRNAGFVSAGMAAEPHVLERTHGLDAVRRTERTVIEAIAAIGDVVEAESIDCGYTRGGSFRFATNAAQLQRIRDGLAGRRRRGFTEDDVFAVSATEIRERVRIEGVVGGTYTPHCARVDPARLARGLATACERHGVTIHERTRATAIGPGRVVTDQGTVTASWVVRTTESYTTRLPGERRRYLPISSHMIATEPLPASVWAEVGWERRETIADAAHLFVYAQRTADDRIAIGGRGAPSSFRSRIREADEVRPAIHARVAEDLRRLFPAAAGARITHRWGGPFASPRDWSMAIEVDRPGGYVRAGGFAGHGVTAANVTGRTIADVILGHETDLVLLPFVGRHSPRWEPEPLRSFGARVIPLVLGSADRAEVRTGRLARRARLVERWTPGR